MFTIEELKWIKSTLKDTESQDEITLNIVEKIDKVLSTASNKSECLWKYYVDCGRQGVIEGVFKATKEEVDAAIGQEVYFGEILGKHSEVGGTLEATDIKLITDNPIEVMNNVESGYNPLDYIQHYCEKCECSYYADEWDFDKGVCYYCAEEDDK